MSRLFNTAAALIHAVLHKVLDALVERYSVPVLNIGFSILGRDLPALRLGEGPKKLLYVGAHHASEWLTATALLHFSEQLLGAARASSRLTGVDAAGLLKAVSIFVVPMLNPDGVEIEQRGAEGGGIFSERLLLLNGGFDFTHWQANARGVDLNHNYEAGWAEAKMLEREAGIFGGGPTRYGGEFPESEPESAALCAFVRSVDFDAVLALHSQGEEIYYDFGGLAPAGSEQIATVLSKVSGYRAAKPSGIASLSGFKDWFIATYNRPGFTVEMGLGENPLPPQEFDAFYRPLEPLLALLPTLI